jgi:hypothetical protein
LRYLERFYIMTPSGPSTQLLVGTDDLCLDHLDTTKRLARALGVQRHEIHVAIYPTRSPLTLVEVK